MNRTRRQLKAAKARKDWEHLQEQKLKKEKADKKPELKKVKNTEKEDLLRDTA